MVSAFASASRYLPPFTVMWYSPHSRMAESTEKLTVLKKQLARNEKRIADLKRLFMKIYEDNASGCLLYTS